MRIRQLGFVLASSAILGMAAPVAATPAVREPLATNAAAPQLRAQLDSGLAEWRAARPAAKTALARVRHAGAPRVEGVLTRLDGIVGRLETQFTARRLTPAQLAELGRQLQSEEDKLREEIKKAREEAKAGFEDADQRTNQLLNILVGILRTMNEMRAGGCKGCL